MIDQYKTVYSFQITVCRKFGRLTSNQTLFIRKSIFCLNFFISYFKSEIIRLVCVPVASFLYQEFVFVNPKFIWIASIWIANLSRKRRFVSISWMRFHKSELHLSFVISRFRIIECIPLWQQIGKDIERLQRSRVSGRCTAPNW